MGKHNHESTRTNRSEKFSQIASGMQNLFFCIAAIVGAWWAVRTYYDDHPDRYEEGVEISRSVMPVSISATQLDSPSSNRLISVRVKFNNTGHITELFPLSDNPLVAVKLDPLSGNIHQTSLAIAQRVDRKGKLVPQEGVAVPKKADGSALFLLQVAEPGVYLLQFRYISSIFDPSGMSVAQEHISVK